MNYEKTCPICGKTFVANHYMCKYCSSACKKVANAENMRRYYARRAAGISTGWVKKLQNCRLCGKPIPENSHRLYYCSKECAETARVAATRGCDKTASQRHREECKWLFGDAPTEGENILESDEEKVIFLFQKSIHPKLISKILNIPLESVDEILVEAKLISSYAALYCEGESIDGIVEAIGTTQEVVLRHLPPTFIKNGKPFADYPSPHAQKLREYRKKKEQQEQG